MADEVYGRTEELRSCASSATGRGAPSCPCFRRRRVGKSELILRFMGGEGIYFVGKQAPGGAQLREFLAVALRAIGEPLLADARVSG